MRAEEDAEAGEARVYDFIRDCSRMTCKDAVLCAASENLHRHVAQRAILCSPGDRSRYERLYAACIAAMSARAPCYRAVFELAREEIIDLGGATIPEFVSAARERLVSGAAAVRADRPLALAGCLAEIASVHIPLAPHVAVAALLTAVACAAAKMTRKKKHVLHAGALDEHRATRSAPSRRL